MKDVLCQKWEFKLLLLLFVILVMSLYDIGHFSPTMHMNCSCFWHLRVETFVEHFIKYLQYAKCIIVLPFCIESNSSI